jgi:hypothetical protein
MTKDDTRAESPADKFLADVLERWQRHVDEPVARRLLEEELRTLAKEIERDASDLEARRRPTFPEYVDAEDGRDALLLIQDAKEAVEAAESAELAWTVWRACEAAVGFKFFLEAAGELREAVRAARQIRAIASKGGLARDAKLANAKHANIIEAAKNLKKPPGTRLGNVARKLASRSGLSQRQVEQILKPHEGDILSSGVTTLADGT